MSATDTAANQAPIGDAEREALRKAVRSLLESRCTEQDVRAVIESGELYDSTLWSTLIADIGTLGLCAPQSLGGQDATFLEQAVVLEELGRALCPSPYLGNLLTVLALVRSGDAALASEYVPGLIDGELTANVAVPELIGTHITCELVATAGNLYGTVDCALGLARAPLSLVIAAEGDGAESEAGLGVYLAMAQDAEQLDGLDLTMPLASISFEGAHAHRLGGNDFATWLLDAGAIALACEQIGAAEAVLHSTLRYVTVREQFGRPIGSFQAVKHRCADMFVAITSARAALRQATTELVEDGPERSILASIAKTTCSEAFSSAAVESLQLHGGLGFTWEHSAHLYLRRAKSSEYLLGSPEQHRGRLAQLLSLP
jgi:alkylation response protein AidB-like acyl-CoA dehydrogenase